MLEGDESTFQQQKHDPNKIMKPVEEECHQSDLRLGKYAQNSHQILLLKMSDRHVRSRQIYPVEVLDMSGPLRNYLLNFDC
jgi:hypothetical protein